LQEEEDEITRSNEQNRRRMANLRTKVKQMNNEISRNDGEKVQRWLHDSYNGAYDDIHSTKSREIVQTSTNSMVTVKSQHPDTGMPQNFVRAGDKTHLNDVFKLLARQVLGIDFPKVRCSVTNFVELTINQDGSLLKITGSVFVAC
jgi:ribosomal protein S20